MAIDDRQSDRALTVLQEAVGNGRIDLVEFDRRSALIVQATPTSIAQALDGLAPTEQHHSQQVQRPRHRQHSRSRRRSGYGIALQIEWAAWACVSVINIAIWLIIAVAVKPVYFWPVWVIGPWAVALGIREAIQLLKGKRSSFVRSPLAPKTSLTRGVPGARDNRCIELSNPY